MLALKPWYTVATLREDLREGRPLDASEFAIHLDHVRDGRAPSDYQTPERFFAHTYLSVRAEIEQVFKKDGSVERVFFPERSNQIPDRASLTLDYGQDVHQAS